MRAVILSLDTGAYKAKADVAAAASLKRMLEQVGIEVRAAKAFPEDKEMLKTVLCKLADAGMAELVLTTGAVGFLEKHCAPDAVRVCFQGFRKHSGLIIFVIQRKGFWIVQRLESERRH